jgi:hypothetical protein
MTSGAGASGLRPRAGAAEYVVAGGEMNMIKNILCVLVGMVSVYGVVTGLFACVEGFLTGDRPLQMAGFSYMVVNIVIMVWMAEWRKS